MVYLTTWKRDQDRNEMPLALTRLRSHMDRLFDRFLDVPFWNESDLAAAGAWAPAIDVQENDDEITVCAEMPGLKPEDIDISMSGNMLSIHAERKEQTEETQGGFHRRERRFGSFARSIELPAEADANRISAEYRAGELVVRVPKSEAARPRRIPVIGTGETGGKVQPTGTTSKRT
jgi:HSP20 family protein